MVDDITKIKYEVIINSLKKINVELMEISEGIDSLTKVVNRNFRIDDAGFQEKELDAIINEVDGVVSNINGTIITSIQNNKLG